MSLIRIRRERRELSGSGVRKPQPIGRLVLLLVLVGIMIWWMTSFGG